jgi:pimeloyl-ACP methyl ester carboxylesterase
VTLPLLMLPGHMCDARLWSMVAPALTAARRELHYADITTASSIEGIASAVLASAPDHFVAVGLSMGGIVAFELLRQQPERIRAMVLCDTNPAAETAAKAAMRRAQQQHVREGALADVVRDELKPAYLAAANRERKDLLDLTFTMAMDLGPDVFLSQSEALLQRPDSWPLLPAIACPTLLLCGAEDAVCTPALHRAMTDAIPSSRLSLVPDAGHLPPLEQPETFASLLLEWLRIAALEPHA